MNLSVALCTYNGSLFIKEQLTSILSQSVSVDEIIICDDGSSDSTIQIVNSIRDDSKIPIQIFRNELQLGVVENFRKAISLCSGEIIFLCDQDDIWVEDKVETIVEWFKLNPEKSAVFSDAELIDDRGQIIADSNGLFDALGFSKRIRNQFDQLALDVFVKYNRATGATMAVRRSLFDRFSLYSSTADRCYPLHDAQIAYAAIGEGSLGYIDKRLIKYRIHSSQECGLGEFVRKPRKESVYNLFYSEGCLTIPEIDDKILFLKKKKAYRESSFGIEVLIHAKEYQSHYGAGWLLFYIYDFLVGVKSFFCEN